MKAGNRHFEATRKKWGGDRLIHVPFSAERVAISNRLAHRYKVNIVVPEPVCPEPPKGSHPATTGLHLVRREFDAHQYCGVVAVRTRTRNALGCIVSTKFLPLISLGFLAFN